MQEEAPRQLLETFDIPLEEVEVDPKKNMRPSDDIYLQQLAVSLATEGQLQNVLVVWNGHAFEIAVGFQRAHAMLKFRGKLGFQSIRAMRIRPEQAAGSRLAENFVRSNPTTYQLAAYFSDLQRGRNMETAMSVPEIAAVVGKSVEYVRSLIRFFRDVPPDAKKAWAEDRDDKFTFRALNDLVRLVRQKDEAGAHARLEQILQMKPRAKKTSDAPYYKTAEHCLEACLNGSMGDEKPTTERRSRKRRTNGMTVKEIGELVALLERADERRLEIHDVPANIVRELMRALVGKQPRARAAQIIEGILADTSGSEIAPPPAAQ